jgi:hypothetical protein
MGHNDTVLFIAAYSVLTASSAGGLGFKSLPDNCIFLHHTCHRKVTAPSSQHTVQKACGAKVGIMENCPTI